MRVILWAGLCLSSLLFSSCTSIQCGANKAQFLEQYDRFMEEVLDEEMTLTDPRWEIYDDHFQFYLTDCYVLFKPELSTSDKHDVLMGALRYYFIRYGSHMSKEIANDDNEASAVLKHELNTLLQESGESMTEFIDEEWGEMTNRLLEDLDKMRQSLIDILEENE